LQFISQICIYHIRLGEALILCGIHQWLISAHFHCLLSASEYINSTQGRCCRCARDEVYHRGVMYTRTKSFTSCSSHARVITSPLLILLPFFPLPILYSDISIVNKSDPHALEVLMTVGLDWPAFSRDEIFDSHESRPLEWPEAGVRWAVWLRSY
jgi:hypothetical protein